MYWSNRPAEIDQPYCSMCIARCTNQKLCRASWKSRAGSAGTRRQTAAMRLQLGATGRIVLRSGLRFGQLGVALGPADDALARR